MKTDEYANVGGKVRRSKLKHGKGSTYWDFGWIPPERREDHEDEGVDKANAEMPDFEIKGKSNNPDDVLLYELWKHPLVVGALGFEYPGTHQLTGSCVGAGGGNVLATLIFFEVVKLKEPEQIVVPFWLLPYGRSRFYLGDRGRGEGSTGTTFAKAAREDGVIPANMAGLPTFKNTDGLIWGSDTEMSWSDGDAQQTMNLLPESKKYIVKTTARCKTADDVWQAIGNGYPVTEASMFGFNAKVEGTPPVLLGRRGPRWSHQMSIQGRMMHPQLGRLFFCMNQWGRGAHGHDPFGGPAGGVWITEKDMQFCCDDEVYAFSQHQGFPAQTFSWGLGDEILPT